jgi:RNA polymerase sigma-70 factor (ECF subfamily)
MFGGNISPVKSTTGSRIVVDQSMSQDSPNPNGEAQRSLHRTGVNARELEDMGLLNRIQSGDQEAMSAFFDRYSTMVYSVALRVLKDSGEAEDVMQEVFVQVWRNPGAFVSGRGSLGGWLVVVARNRAIDVLRRRRPSDPVELFALPSVTNLAQQAEQSVLMAKVRSAMLALPAEQKSSVELAFFEGLSHSEIAEKTGDPLGTVKTRIRLALTTIRKALNV